LATISPVRIQIGKDVNGPVYKKGGREKEKVSSGPLNLPSHFPSYLFSIDTKKFPIEDI